MFRDSVTVYVNAIMYYRVMDAVKVRSCYNKTKYFKLRWYDMLKY